MSNFSHSLFFLCKTRLEILPQHLSHQQRESWWVGGDRRVPQDPFLLKVLFNTKTKDISNTIMLYMHLYSFCVVTNHSCIFYPFIPLFLAVLQISAGFHQVKLGERGGRRRDFHDAGINTRQSMEHVKESKMGLLCF